MILDVLFVMLVGSMKKSNPSSIRSSVAGNTGMEGTSTQSKGDFVPGSLIWVRLNGDSWWPAQVVDGDTVSESNKPSKRLAGEVLVRLYGSYKHLYADPLKCRNDFESVLKQNNGSYHHVFVKALKTELASSTSAKLKERGCKHTERRNGASQDNGSNQDMEDRNQNLEDRKSGDADAEGYTDLTVKRTGGHSAHPIAEGSKMKLGSQRAEGATLRTFQRSKTHRKERLSDNQDPSNTKDGLPTTPRTVEAGESGISRRERIDKCLELKNRSTEHLKIRTPNQDWVEKNHESTTDNASVSAKRKSSKLKQDSVSSRIKLYGRSAAEKAKLRISGQLGPQAKPKAIVTSIESKVESKSLKKHYEVKNEQKQKSFCQHEQQGYDEVDRHDSMARGLKRKDQIMDHDKECKILKQEEKRKNCKPSSTRVDENSINESPLLERSVKKLDANKRKTEQDNVQKELESNIKDNVQKELESNIKDNVQKELESNIKYAKEETKRRPAKEVESVKKKKPASATTPSPSSTGRAQELSTRQLRVMRSLGLISPAGSPFPKGRTPLS